MAVVKNALMLCFSGLFILLMSCNKTGLFKDDEIDIVRAPLENDSFRVDGYYYTPNEERSNILFFYKNGAILDLGAYKTSEIPSVEESFKTDFNTNMAKYHWGVVEISKTQIKFEQWKPEEGGLKAYTYEGIVNSDTSFSMTKVYRNENGKITDESSRNSFFVFKHLQPKPDSTNDYVK